MSPCRGNGTNYDSNNSSTFHHQLLMNDYFEEMFYKIFVLSSFIINVNISISYFSGWCIIECSFFLPSYFLFPSFLIEKVMLMLSSKQIPQNTQDQNDKSNDNRYFINYLLHGRVIFISSILIFTDSKKILQWCRASEFLSVYKHTCNFILYICLYLYCLFIVFIPPKEQQQVEFY